MFRFLYDHFSSSPLPLTPSLFLSSTSCVSKTHSSIFLHTSFHKMFTSCCVSVLQVLPSSVSSYFLVGMFLSLNLPIDRSMLLHFSSLLSCLHFASFLLGSFPANFFVRFGCRNITLHLFYCFMQLFHFFSVPSFLFQCIEKLFFIILVLLRCQSLLAESRCNHLLSRKAFLLPPQFSHYLMVLLSLPWLFDLRVLGSLPCLLVFFVFQVAHFSSATICD